MESNQSNQNAGDVNDVPLHWSQLDRIENDAKSILGIVNQVKGGHVAIPVQGVPQIQADLEKLAVNLTAQAAKDDAANATMLATLDAILAELKLMNKPPEVAGIAVTPGTPTDR